MTKFIVKFDKFLDKLRNKQVLLILFVLIILSCWRLLNLYISHDDWDLFFKVVYPESGVWGTGPGPFGTGPYRYFHTVFVALYPFLKFNFAAYFFIGMLFYLFAAFAFYLLILEITKSRKISIIVASIFSSIGIFGSDALMHLQHLYAMFGMLGFSFLTLWTLLRHFKTGKIFPYILSLIFFSFTEEFYVLRGHGLIFVVIFGSLLFIPFKKKIKELLFFGLRLLPFFLIYDHQYNSGGGGFLNTALNYLRSYNGALGSLINFPATFTNSLIPDFFSGQVYASLTRLLPFALFFVILQVIIVRKISKIFFIFLPILLFNYLFFLFSKWSIAQPISRANGFNDFSGFLGFIGLEIGFTLLLLAIKYWNTEKVISRLLLFGPLWFFSQYLGYFIASPQYDLLNTGHRYMTPEIAGSAIIFASLISLIKNLKVKYLTLFILIGCFIYLVNSEIARNAQEINLTRNVYARIVKETPKLPKKPLIFFDYENDPILRGRVRDAYPNTAFALFYGFNDRIPSAPTFPDLVNFLKIGKTTLKNIETFYIGKNFVENTTNDVRSLLSNGSENTLIQAKWKTDGSNKENLIEPVIQSDKNRTLSFSPSASLNLSYKSVVPLLLTLKISASPINFEGISYPYQDLTGNPEIGEITNSQDLSEFSINTPNLDCSKRIEVLKQELEHENFIKSASVSADSEWEDNKVANLIDGNYATDWTAHPNYWNYIGRVGITVDLRKIENIKTVSWVNHFKRTTPIGYFYSVSDDGISWKTIKTVENGSPREDDEIVSDSLPNGLMSRFLKMEITKTLTAVSPSIRELWVSQDNSSFSNDSKELISAPFLCPIKNANEALDVLSYLPQIKAKLLWRSNSDKLINPDNNQEISLIPDGQVHIYNFYIPAGGINLQELKISDLQIPLSIKIEDSSIRSLSLREIEQSYSK